MRIFSRRTLREFWVQRGREDSKQPLLSWFRVVERANWTKPSDVKRQFRSASFIGDNRVIFNVAGNKYRLVVHINYAFRAAYICFEGTHDEYDLIDPKKV
jgi:mRNA interferase HigB